jgi:ribosomal protein S18 acetylase RimI-like enzyme
MTDAAPTVRPATATDVPELVPLNAALFREDAGSRDPYADLDWPRRSGEQYFHEAVADGERSAVWVAEVEGRAVGYLLGRLQAPTDVRPVASASLESLYIAADHRGGGIGEALVDQFIAWARRQGAGRATVSAYADNEGANRFYRRLGFAARSTMFDRAL